MSVLSDAYQQIWDGQISCYDTDLVTINGVDYPCSGGEQVLTNELAFGGLIAEPTCLISLKTSLLPTRPMRGDRVTYRGKVFKIKADRSASDDTVITMELEPTK